MPSYARLFRGMVRAFTLPEVNCLLELAPQFTLPDPQRGFILFHGSRWRDLGRGVVNATLYCLRLVVVCSLGSKRIVRLEPSEKTTTNRKHTFLKPGPRVDKKNKFLC